MSKPEKTRQGLTRCPRCRAHIKAGERPSLTECPFCGANQHRARGRLAPIGRGGALAASLFAFSAAGCGGGDASDDATVEPSDDGTSGGDSMSGGDDSNRNGDDGYGDEPPDDGIVVAEYGVPPEDELEVDEPAPQPLYGVPPE